MIGSTVGHNLERSYTVDEWQDDETASQDVEQVERFDAPAEDDRVTRDQKRITEWHEAAQAAPSSDEMHARREAVREAEAILADARNALEAGAAQRACVYGWGKVAEEEGVTAKRVHAWHREHTPDLPDLSTVPGREMAREERRITAEAERLEAEARLRERIIEQQARLTEIKKGLNR